MSETPRRSAVFRISRTLADKPNSVPILQLPAAGKNGDDHLSGTFITERLERHSPYHFFAKVIRDTALHGGKDLVVAPPPYGGIIPKGNPLPFGFGVTVGTSHLTMDGYYPLPFCTFLRTARVRTFLPLSLFKK